MKLVSIANNLTLNHLPCGLLVNSFTLRQKLSSRFLGRFYGHTWSKSHIHALQQGICGVGAGLNAPGRRKISLINFNVTISNDVTLDEYVTFTPVDVEEVDVTLKRNLKAGMWNTIVLPMAMSSAQISSAFGAGSAVYQRVEKIGKTVLAIKYI